MTLDDAHRSWSGCGDLSPSWMLPVTSIHHSVGEQGEKMKINLLERRELTCNVCASSYTVYSFMELHNAPLGKIYGVEFIFCELVCTSCDTACPSLWTASICI
jgi:hypothetical protein